jgi:hypothetical protein
LRGLERRFAEQVLIQPSYWSQIKGRSRQIGERLARQFEQRCRKPLGWMDLRHGDGAPPAVLPPPEIDELPPTSSMPRDDDERFIVGLVLTYYRRHPQRARTRLLDLLGEVLMPTQPGSTPPAAPTQATPVRARSPGGVTARPARPDSSAPAEDPSALWLKVQARVAPLKKKV